MRTGIVKCDRCGRRVSDGAEEISHWGTLTINPFNRGQALDLCSACSVATQIFVEEGVPDVLEQTKS